MIVAAANAIEAATLYIEPSFGEASHARRHDASGRADAPVPLGGGRVRSPIANVMAVVAPRIAIGRADSCRRQSPFWPRRTRPFGNSLS